MKPNTTNVAVWSAELPEFENMLGPFRPVENHMILSIGSDGHHPRRVRGGDS